MVSVEEHQARMEADSEELKRLRVEIGQLRLRVSNLEFQREELGKMLTEKCDELKALSASGRSHCSACDTEAYESGYGCHVCGRHIRENETTKNTPKDLGGYAMGYLRDEHVDGRPREKSGAMQDCPCAACRKLRASEICECPACRLDGPHDSDCAVHNSTAYPISDCDCSVLDGGPRNG